MRYLFTTEQLITLFQSSGLECSPASPFRTLCALNSVMEDAEDDLTAEEKLLAKVALCPEKTLVCGRHSTAEGPLYLLRSGAIWYVYLWMEKQDRHAFYAYYDTPALAGMLRKNFCGFYHPDFGAFSPLNLRLDKNEAITWNLIRAYFASRARVSGFASNEPFSADDLKDPDLALYLRNPLDEVGFSDWSDAVDELMDESRHEGMDAALRGLQSKQVLAYDVNPMDHNEVVYSLTRTAIERLDDGLLIDTVFFADRTDPDAPQEILFCLRRDGVLAYCPVKDGVVLRTLSEIPWEELL